MFPRARYQQLHATPRPQPGAPGRLRQARSRPPPARGTADMPPGAGGASLRSQKKKKAKKNPPKKPKTKQKTPNGLKANFKMQPFLFFSFFFVVCYPAPSPPAETPPVQRGGGRGDRRH